MKIQYLNNTKLKQNQRNEWLKIVLNCGFLFFLLVNLQKKLGKAKKLKFVACCTS